MSSPPPPVTSSTLPEYVPSYLLHSSFFFFFPGGSVLSPLKNESVYMSKPFQGSWPFNYQLLFLHVYLPEFSTGSLLSANRYALVPLNLKQTVGNSEMQVPFHREIIVWWQLRNLIKVLDPTSPSSLGLSFRHLACLICPPLLPPVYLIEQQKYSFFKKIRLCYFSA